MNHPNQLINGRLKHQFPIWLSLGSNLGDRNAYLETAVHLLSSQIKIIKLSQFYETQAWGNEDQPPFLNCCLSATTTLSPLQLLAHTQQVEQKIGRQKTKHWGPRTIDIDILFYADLIYHDATLTIPHPFLQERAFVLTPLHEIAPLLRDPRTGNRLSPI